jgi:5,10-methylenetetrahydrofolate reductase
LGIENVLALTGDYPTLGDHPQAKPVFDLDSVQLIALIQALNSGKDLAGNELSGKTDFFVGAVINPAADPLEPHLLRLRLKVELGARFVQTQAVFDPDAFVRFAQKAEPFRVPILAGIIPLKSAKMARFMNENIAGIRVPEELIREMEGAKTAEDRKKKCGNLCADHSKSSALLPGGSPHAHGLGGAGPGDFGIGGTVLKERRERALRSHGACGLADRSGGGKTHAHPRRVGREARH